jgi:hypothetical protein
MRADRSSESHLQRSVERLAREAQVPASEVARLYEHARAELEVGARIKGFVGIFALRKVRKILRQRATSSSVSPVRLSSLPGGKSR